MALVRSQAERIVVLFNDEVVADHPRHFRRDQIIYDPWHYLPVLPSSSPTLRSMREKCASLPQGLSWIPSAMPSFRYFDPHIEEKTHDRKLLLDLGVPAG